MNIVIIEGADLRSFLALLGVVDASIYRVRVWASESGVKFKINEGMWTPALGKADPK